MSLQNLANHLQSAGRGDDSMLVHMTPGEVHGLQTLAMSHGGSLTINPETGLPEAGFLSNILSAALPVAAGFALGPAGFGLMESSLGAAAAVGGISALATGSLQKGLMAGLGAYGGAGLGESLASAAPTVTSAGPQVALGQQAAEEAGKKAFENQLAASTGLTSEGGYAGLQGLDATSLYGQGLGGLTPAVATPTTMAEYAAQQAAANPLLASQQAAAAQQAAMRFQPLSYATPLDKLSAGATQAAANPLPFLKANAGKIGMAAAPLIGSLAVEQTPLGNVPAEKALIRPYTFNANPTGADATNTETVYNGSLPSREKMYFAPTMTAETPYLAPGPEYNNPSLYAGSAGVSSIGGGQNPYFWGNQGVNPYDPYNPQAAQKPLSGFGRMLFQNARGYANGGLLAEKTGAVESMSDANAIGANNSYPMSNQPQPAYLLNTARPAAGNVINPSSGMAVDPFSGEQQFAAGGIASLGGYSDGGRLLKGPGDGLSDGIPARIGNKQPARLADGEFVIPADVVSAMGGGSTDAGAKKFYAMLDRIRRQAHGKKKQIRKVSEKVLPA